MPIRRKTLPLYPKELSWLSFNARVLQEAEDPEVPLIERVRFMGIFSNNLDEFYRVRYAEVRRLAAFAKGREKARWEKLLDDIRDAVGDLQMRFDRVYRTCLAQLRTNNIYLVDERQLDAQQRDFVRQYFFGRVMPELAPIIISDATAMPQLEDGSIYFAVRIQLRSEAIRYAIVNIPSDRLPRFIVVPSPAGQPSRQVIVVLDNIIRACLHQVFRGVFDIERAEAFTFKITRDAELELGEGITQSLVDALSSSLKKRKLGDPVRLVYDRRMPNDMLDIMVKRFRLGSYDNVLPGARYHNSKDFMDFPNLGARSLENRPIGPLMVPRIDRHANIFAAIAERDILLNYPYHSFRYTEQLLAAAAIDPAVRAIQVTLYRVARNSHIGNSLICAALNGKEVFAIVELRARFDEAANIDWAKRLTEAGVHVVFGIPGLKVHSKLILISRQEGTQLRRYAHIGTGNFNEKTARIYTDLALFTANQEIAEDVRHVFDFIRHTYRRHKFRHLAVSPLTNRSTFLRLIHTEVVNARAGRPAAIFLKCNNLVDEELIDRLYEASQAGVKIRVIVRGMCSLVAGAGGVSDNIEVISIVDRFLEHSRVYVFENGGETRYFISSADVMTRNLDHRVEVTAPVYDKLAQRRLQRLLDTQWADNVKARVLSADQDNSYRDRGTRRRLRSQEVLARYYADDQRRETLALEQPEAGGDGPAKPQ
ncbi:MAG: polyphosphate kinase 1 [Pseudomonadales bacterium]|jgi:polyphosphate kinase|nr:polyphosphate kinase 1 [Pseudomonadales bacterium]MBP9032330.1 polyphosphate kinase 1 [Pseudomonadales bacterium]